MKDTIASSKSTIYPICVFGRRISVHATELPAKITDRMKPTGKTDFLQGSGGLIKQPLGCLQAVLDERLHRRTPQIRMKAPSGFTSAYMGGMGYICERNRIGIMLVNIR